MITKKKELFWPLKTNVKLLEIFIELSSNKKLCEIREVFEKYNLISGLHTFMSQKDDRFKNLLPPLKVLDSQDKIDLLTNLKNIKFEINQLKAA